MKEVENEKVAGVIPGRFMPFGEVAKKREQLSKSVALAFKEYKGGGLGRGLPKETQKLIEEATGAGSDAHFRNETDDMDRAIESVRKDVSTAFKSRGVGHAIPSYARKTGPSEAKPAQKALTPSQALKLARERYAKDKNDAVARQTIEALTAAKEE
jgi:hypothetical protein